MFPHTTVNSFLDELVSINKEASAAGFRKWLRTATDKQLSKAHKALETDSRLRSKLKPNKMGHKERDARRAGFESISKAQRAGVKSVKDGVSWPHGARRYVEPKFPPGKPKDIFADWLKNDLTLFPAWGTKGGVRASKIPLKTIESLQNSAIKETQRRSRLDPYI